MSELAQILSEMIKTDGPVSVARYMQLALQHPQYGYYVKGDPLGCKGDFITAPEVSQMFGEMIGVWLAAMWRKSGKPDPFVLLELGPGRGTLMADALRASAHVEGFHKAMKLCFIESNQTLRDKQKEKLSAEEINYFDDVSSLPTDMPVFAIANEFFDALPIHQYKNTPEGWREIMVGQEGDAFAFVEGAEIMPLPLPQDLPFYELSPVSVALCRAFSARIAAQGGAALIVDYGYDRPSGNLSLQAVSGHKTVNSLEKAGEVDLTAHVDFGTLALAAKMEGLCAIPIIGQGAFLKNMGIDIRAHKLKKGASDSQVKKIDAALYRLIDPSDMGTLFKVMSISTQRQGEVIGFS